MRLNELKDKPGANKARMRVGRGIGSGKGKTAGRGVKGQKSRAGVAIKGFEGGQNPIHMRLPKRGFNSLFRPEYTEINLARVQEAVDAGKLDLSATVDGAALKAAGVIRREKDGVRLLGEGELRAKVNFELAGASASARQAVEAAGGTISLKLSPRAARKLAAREARASEATAE
jgi:large subunit ribosomal protein L15